MRIAHSTSSLSAAFTTAASASGVGWLANASALKQLKHAASINTGLA